MSDEAAEAVEVAGEAGLFRPLEDLLFDAPKTEACPNCDLPVYSEDTFCESCGTQLPGRVVERDDPGILPTVQKQPRYLGENIPGANNIFGLAEANKAVVYLDDSERAQLALSVGEDGKLYDADGNLFDTTGAPGNKAIWVMDKDGNLYAATTQDVGTFQHSSILAGKPVAGAGEIEVSNGEIVSINDKSGHYLPTREFTMRAVNHLRSQGVNISDSQILFTAKR
jgi:hypothetical protein